MRIVFPITYYQLIGKLVFANYLSTDIKLSKTQLSKMMHSEGILGRLLGSLLKTRFPLMKNVIKPLAKSFLTPIGLTVAASAADAGIHKKVWGSGNTTTLIISKDELEYIIKIVKTLEDSGLLLKGVSETIQNKVEKQKGGSISMLLGTSGGSLLGKGSMLTG